MLTVGALRTLSEMSVALNSHGLKAASTDVNIAFSKTKPLTPI